MHVSSCWRGSEQSYRYTFVCVHSKADTGGLFPNTSFETRGVPVVSLSTARKRSSVQHDEAVSFSLTCPAQSKGDSLQKWWGREIGLLIIPTDCSCSSARKIVFFYF